jgi:hypothetical protein
VLAPIARIEGREGDILMFPSATRGADSAPVPVYADLVMRAMIHAGGFGEFRVTQAGPSELVIELDALSDDARESVSREITTLMTRLGCAVPAIEFTPFVRDLSTKLRRIQRRF